MNDRQIITLPVKDCVVPVLTDATLHSALETPHSFVSFLREFQVMEKFRLATDATYGIVHEHARRTILAVRAAPNREQLVAVMRLQSTLPKSATEEALILDAIVGYRKKDSTARCRDNGTQAYLDMNNITPEETGAKIRELGGVQATYLAHLDIINSRAPRPKKRPVLTKAAAKKACPGGGKLIAIMEVDKTGKVSVVEYRLVPDFATKHWTEVLVAVDGVMSANGHMHQAAAAKPTQTLR